MSDDWQDISTAPIGKTILFWWRPRSQNPYAEAAVIGELSEHYPSKWYNSQTGQLQDVWHVTHWQPLPQPPKDKP